MEENDDEVCPELKEQIIEYLTHKNIYLKAALLRELKKIFCDENSSSKVSFNCLLDWLFYLLKKRIIEIVIPEPFQIKWEKKNLKNLKYLNDGIYFVRHFSYFLNKNENLKDFEKNRYFFDSRALDFTNQVEIDKLTEGLYDLIKNHPEIENSIIIYYPSDSVPLNVYESFEGAYNLNDLNFQLELDDRFVSKIDIPIFQQKSDLFVLQNYLNNYSCAYITLIQTIHKLIIDYQANKERQKNIKDYNFGLNNLIKKFVFYSLAYVKSDWIEIKPNPKRWESFFTTYELPFRSSMDFLRTSVYGRTINIYGEMRFYVELSKDFKNIENLKKLGFSEFTKNCADNDKITFGLKVELFFPCPAIEYLYFLMRYVYFYFMFLLFCYSFSYIKEIKPTIKFIDKEQMLYETFSPVINSFFNIEDSLQDDNINKKLVFKYYTLNAEELEVIYNTFLLKKVREIEKKMFKYFLIRSSKSK